MIRVCVLWIGVNIIGLPRYSAFLISDHTNRRSKTYFQQIKSIEFYNY